MRRARMNISLVVSNKMSELSKEDPEEHNRIRLSSKARLYFQPSEQIVEVTIEGKGSVILHIHQALMSDISNPDTDIGKVGFVTKETYDSIIGGTNPSHIWVSESIDELVVGSDPEFGLVDKDTGSFVYAKEATNHGLNEPIGHDGPCMELRPTPDASIDKHMENVKGLIKKATTYRTITPYKWWTGATFKAAHQDRRYNLGGHIHIGNPTALENRGEAELEGIQRRVIRVLDELVGLPLINIDTPVAGQRRASGYGHYGDFRRQTNRFEWRTPSAIWLTHPEIARAVLGTTKAVSEECYRRMADKKFDAKWVSAYVRTEKSFLHAMKCMDDGTVQKDLLLSDRNKTEDKIASIHKRLVGMSTYKKYKEYIDEFIRITKLTPEQTSKIDLYSMRESWLNSKSLQ